MMFLVEWAVRLADPFRISPSHGFSISSGLQPGINTLDFLVNNDDGPIGLRVEMRGTASQAPQPASFALLGLGIAGLALRRRVTA